MTIFHNPRGPAWRKFLAGVVVLFVATSPLGAHNGPPFPIISDKRVGPVVVSLWTHPDVGTGLFYVIVDAPPGGAIPADLKIEIGVRPVTGRLAEVTYPMKLETLRGQVVYRADAQFDQQELWQVRMIVKSSAGDGEASADVEVTPPGYGRWDLLLFSLPFLGVGFLWFRVMMRKRKYRQSQLQKATS
ncbi:MAG: hypothetical protein WCF88_06590 [Candidatus Acidiferrales bacterium]|jgi:hypothetical protein